MSQERASIALLLMFMTPKSWWMYSDTRSTQISIKARTWYEVSDSPPLRLARASLNPELFLPSPKINVQNQRALLPPKQALAPNLKWRQTNVGLLIFAVYQWFALGKAQNSLLLIAVSALLKREASQKELSTTVQRHPMWIDIKYCYH